MAVVSVPGFLISPSGMLIRVFAMRLPSLIHSLSLSVSLFLCILKYILMLVFHISDSVFS